MCVSLSVCVRVYVQINGILYEGILLLQSREKYVTILSKIDYIPVHYT